MSLTRALLPSCGAADASAVSVASPVASGQPITLSPTAHAQVMALAKAQGGDTVLRCGVRAGGCSGMSYTMDFVPASSVTEDDTVVDADGVTLAVDPKSLLFLYGLNLDYSSALIGGGFKFSNPNASASCGCGTSFSA